MKYTLRIPMSDQYSYTEITCDNIDDYNQAKENYLSFKEIKQNNTSNLQPIPFLRLLHKYMVENRLEMQDIESLGTDKLYSQKDVVNLIKNVFAKISREANGGRINKEEDIRYN